MNKYLSHKTVSAFKITKIQGYYPHGVEPKVYALSGAPEAVVVTKDFMDRHGPLVGGYFVRYADGYESFSPAEAFESGYTLVTPEPPAADEQLAYKAKGDLKVTEITEVVTVITRNPTNKRIVETTTVKVAP